jgi:hypothetical protein
MSSPESQTAALYTVVYEVSGDRKKHDEWWRMISQTPDGITVKASASFDALAKLDELEGEVTW